MQWGSNEEAAQSLQLQKGEHLSEFHCLLLLWCTFYWGLPGPPYGLCQQIGKAWGYFRPPSSRQSNWHLSCLLRPACSTDGTCPTVVPCSLGSASGNGSKGAWTWDIRTKVRGS